MRPIIGFHVVLALLWTLLPATVAHAQGGTSYDEEAVYEAIADYYADRIGSVRLIEIIEAELAKPGDGPPSPYEKSTARQAGQSDTCGGERQPPLTADMVFSRIMYYCDGGTWVLVQISPPRNWQDDYNWDSPDPCSAAQKGVHKETGAVKYRTNRGFIGIERAKTECRPDWLRELNEEIGEPNNPQY